MFCLKISICSVKVHHKGDDSGETLEEVASEVLDDPSLPVFNFRLMDLWAT